MKPGKCPNIEVQQNMIDTIGRINQECASGEAIMLFEDAVHQLHTTVSGYAIQRKGKSGTRLLESNSGRQRLTILGAINPHNGRFTKVETTGTCDTELAKLLLKMIVKDYELEIKLGKKIYIILDNARYQRSYEVQTYAKELGVILEYLPPYCPHLNIIERLWKWMKKKIKNKYFPSFKEFCSYVFDTIDKVETEYEMLKSVLSLNFGII